MSLNPFRRFSRRDRENAAAPSATQEEQAALAALKAISKDHEGDYATALQKIAPHLNSPSTLIQSGAVDAYLGVAQRLAFGSEEKAKEFASMKMALLPKVLEILRDRPEITNDHAFHLRMFLRTVAQAEAIAVGDMIVENPFGFLYNEKLVDTLLKQEVREPRWVSSCDVPIWQQMRTDQLMRMAADILPLLRQTAQASVSLSQDPEAVERQHSKGMAETASAIFETMSERASDVIHAVLTALSAHATKEDRLDAEHRTEKKLPVRGPQLLPHAQTTYAAYLKTVEALPENLQPTHYTTLAYHACRLNSDPLPLARKFLADLEQPDLLRAEYALRGLDLMLPAVASLQDNLLGGPMMLAEIQSGVSKLSESPAHARHTREFAGQMLTFWAGQGIEFPGVTAFGSSVALRETMFSGVGGLLRGEETYNYPLRTYITLSAQGDRPQILLKNVGTYNGIEKMRDLRAVVYKAATLDDLVKIDDMTKGDWRNICSCCIEPIGPHARTVKYLIEATPALRDNPAFSSMYRAVAGIEAEGNIENGQRQAEHLRNIFAPVLKRMRPDLRAE